jgi:uncharacterized protein (DUF1015 family)
VAAPPYDVVTRAEASQLAAGNPLSFLHVTRAEIDCSPDTDPYDAKVYATARAALQHFLSDGSFLREAAPSFYLYELSIQGRAQVGVVGCVHVDDYANDIIRKHEKTRKDKEDDRTRHILALNAHPEPVFLTLQGNPFLTQLNQKVLSTPPLYNFTADDGVEHRLWRISDTASYIDCFRRIPVVYVADGHHRCASAWRAGMERREANLQHTGEEEYNWFPAVLFPANQLRILPYNRVVRDLNGLTAEAFLARLAGLGTLTPAAPPAPERTGTFGVFVAGGWHRLEFDPGSIDQRDPIRSLDVSLLHDRVLAPVLGIGDERTDKRLDFIGGARGTAELERRVRSGEMAAAFALYPVTVQQLMTIADAGAILPPKSTWFEPKLRSGLFVHTLD